jgi:hypothetical protein
LWPLINAAVVVLTLAIVLRSLRNVSDLSTRFLCLALWLRMATSSFADYTTTPLLGPLSINAATSLGVIGCGVALLAVNPRQLTLRALVPIYVYLGIVLLSGALNRLPGPAVATLLNWTYLLIVALLLRGAIRRHGCDTALLLIFPVFAMPVALGLASFAVGYGAETIHDGSVSYRGGFVHEAIYSLVVYNALVVALMIRWRHPLVGPVFVMLAMAALLLANYRTTILALPPLAAVVGLGLFRATVPARLRPGVAIVAFIVVGVGVAALVANPPARFAELGDALSLDNVDITEPETLTFQERRLLSSRLFIWSKYLSDHVEADAIRRMLGFGHGAYERIWRHLGLHAHNAFIHETHAVGLIGLGAMLAIMLGAFRLAARLPDRRLGATVTASVIGFMIICLATTPTIVIEGLILLGVIYGVATGATGERTAVGRRGPAAFRMTGARLARPPLSARGEGA